MSRKKKYIEISERKLILRSLDVIVVVLSMYLASLYFDFTYINIHSELIYQWFIVLSIYFLLIGEVFQMYNLDVSNNQFLIVRSIFISTFVTTLFYIFSPYITPSLPENRAQIIGFFFLMTIPIVVWRLLYLWLFFSPKYYKSIIVIGHSSNSENLINLIKKKNFHNVAAYVSEKKIGDFDNYYNIDKVNLIDLISVTGVTEIIVSTKEFSEDVILRLNNRFIQLFGEGINIKGFEKYYEEVTNSVPKEYLNSDFYKNLNFSKNNEHRLYFFISRFLDLISAFLGLLMFLIFLPLIIIGNLFGNRGPLFYSHDRVGKEGKIFKILKLRSMVTDAEKGEAIWALKNDSRITSFGKFLRKTRLDEVPQFYNILKGEMSLIGPRPERPEFVSKLEIEIPFYAIRHVVKPGLTGWAQVCYPYANTMKEQERKLRYDLFYIKEKDLYLDFKILIKTISTVLFFRGQ